MATGITGSANVTVNVINSSRPNITQLYYYIELNDGDRERGEERVIAVIDGGDWNDFELVSSDCVSHRER